MLFRSERSGKHIWYEGPTVEQELAVIEWARTNAPDTLHPWRTFEHPQLGNVEIGGTDDFLLWTNAPASCLRAEVAPHSEFAIHQAMLSPRLEILHTKAESLGNDTWRVELGVANTGWLPTHVTELARSKHLCLPGWVQIDGADTMGSPARVTFGDLAGRSAYLLAGGYRNDGTPDRNLTSWVVRAPVGTAISFTACHERAGAVTTRLTLG